MRRQYFTRPAYQWTYIVYFVTAAFFISTLITFYACTTLWLAKTSIILSTEQMAGLSLGIRQLAWMGAVGGAGLMLLAAGMGFYMSTRSAGPLSRVEAWLEHRLLGINPAKLKLRTRDEFHAVINLLNEIK
jgi:hypothetical protein